MSKSSVKQATVKKGPARAASDAGRSRLGDSTRPIAIDRRLTTDRRWSITLTVFAVVIAAALAASLFIAPVKNYGDQSAQLAERKTQLRELERVNGELQLEVQRLRTTDGIREAAREELGYQTTGEERDTVIDSGLVPTQLPAGWPYDLVTRIANVRRSGG